MLRTIGILTICRNNFGSSRPMRCWRGVGKFAENEPTQKQQRHGQAMEEEFAHTSRVKVATIPCNEWLPSLWELPEEPVDTPQWSGRR
jgi:hypothetical protein